MNEPEISAAVLNKFDREEMVRTSQRESWQDLIAPFRTADHARSWMQLLVTLFGVALCDAAAFFTVEISFWLAAFFVILSAGFLVRTFILFHDCCHGSLFSSQSLNDVVGVLTGILMLTPYYAWRKSHCIHHATTGDLDRRGTGDVITLTVDEWRAAPFIKRVAYRVYRNPLVLTAFGVLVLFFVMNRFTNLHVPAKDGLDKHERRNVHLTTLASVALFFSLWLVGGWTLFFIHFIPSVLAGMTGIFLFYVQHQYEGVYWRRHDDWQYLEASIAGSSWLSLPQPLRFFSGDIGVHHVHHLAPKVPNYRLVECARAIGGRLGEVKKLTLLDALRTTRLKLWDEKAQRLVGWSEVG